MSRLVPLICIMSVLGALALVLLLQMRADATAAARRVEARRGETRRYRIEPRDEKSHVARLLAGAGELVRLYLTRDFLFAALELLFTIIDIALRVSWLLTIGLAERL